MVLLFQSGLDQGEGDESWAFSDVRVSADVVDACAAGSCACEGNWAGEVCERSCGAHGTSDGHACACEGNWAGEFCETECDCSGHGNQTNITAVRAALAAGPEYSSGTRATVQASQWQEKYQQCMSAVGADSGSCNDAPGTNLPNGACCYRYTDAQWETYCSEMVSRSYDECMTIVGSDDYGETPDGIDGPAASGRGPDHCCFRQACGPWEELCRSVSGSGPGPAGAGFSYGAGADVCAAGSCTCEGNWAGEVCERSCGAHGTSDGHACACEGNWAGEFCETECDCSGHGNQTNITAVRETLASLWALSEDGGAQADGWSNAEVTAVDSAGLAHGPWGNDVRDVSKSFIIPGGTTSCTVSWRSWARGSRDGERDSVQLNGIEVWGVSRHHPGAWISDEHTATVACSGSLSVRFLSGIDEHEDNEAWAFSDVRVSAAEFVDACAAGSCSCEGNWAGQFCQTTTHRAGAAEPACRFNVHDPGWDATYHQRGSCQDLCSGFPGWECAAFEEYSDNLCGASFVAAYGCDDDIQTYPGHTGHAFCTCRKAGNQHGDCSELAPCGECGGDHCGAPGCPFRGYECGSESDVGTSFCGRGGTVAWLPIAAMAAAVALLQDLWSF